MGNSN